MSDLTFIDLFAGIGAMRLALESAGWTCKWANEINPYAAQIYRKHFGNKELIEGDIRRVKPEDIPHVDMFSGGFPCQSFSIAGGGEGLEDPRGTLFYEICRLAKAKQPKLLFLENVSGLLSNHKGETFFKILQRLDEIGYDVEWQSFNSKYFGIPHNRERVFIIGHSRKARTQQIFPISTYVKSFNPKTPEKMRLIQVGNVDTKGHNSIWGRVYSPEGICANLNAKGGGLGAKTGLYLVGENKVRRLTPLECERVQGLPDIWTKYGNTNISDAQRYLCIGNAVTTNVVAFLGEKLKHSLLC